jgi:hypothetical protein
MTEMMNAIRDCMKKEDYISIPWKDAGRFIMFVISSVLFIVGAILTIVFWKGLEVEFTKLQIFTLSWLLFVESVLLSLSAVCFSAWIKKGFRYLKNYRELGLIAGIKMGFLGSAFSLLLFLLILITTSFSSAHWPFGVIVVGSIWFILTIFVGLSDEF